MATSGVAGILYATKIIDLRTGQVVNISDVGGDVHWADIIDAPTVFYPPECKTNTLGGVLKTSWQDPSTATDVAGIVADFNTLLLKLKSSKLMSSNP